MLALFRMLCWFGLSSLQEWPEAVLAQLCAKKARKELFALLLGDALQPGELEQIPSLLWPSEHDPFAEPVVGAAFGGSNGIVVDAAHSSTGGALMCRSPPEVGRIPPLLSARTLRFRRGYLQGMEVPGLAYRALGARRTSAGPIPAHVDVMDTYALRCRAGERFDGEAWHKLTRREVEVAVRGKSAERWCSSMPRSARPLARRRAQEQAASDRGCGLRDTAGDFNALRRTLTPRVSMRLLGAQRDIMGLSLFALMADAGGRIGWVLTGRMDERPDHSGACCRVPHGLPRPLSRDRRPFKLDPADGYIASANERHDGPLGERWCRCPSRAIATSA